MEKDGRSKDPCRISDLEGSVRRAGVSSLTDQVSTAVISFPSSPCLCLTLWLK
jgi:hypothetical protein